MNAFNSLLNSVCVADSRFVPLHADALSAEVLECLIPRTVPIGQHTVLAFARKGHTNLAVLLPHHVPQCALEWLLFEVGNGGPTLIEAAFVADSRLFSCQVAGL